MPGRFEYPFQSRYATVDGVRLHYLGRHGASGLAHARDADVERHA